MDKCQSIGSPNIQTFDPNQASWPRNPSPEPNEDKIDAVGARPTKTNAMIASLFSDIKSNLSISNIRPITLGSRRGWSKESSTLVYESPLAAVDITIVIEPTLVFTSWPLIGCNGVQSHGNLLISTCPTILLPSKKTRAYHASCSFTVAFGKRSTVLN